MPETTLREAKDLFWKEVWEDAVSCPVCERTSKVYRLHINFGMRVALVAFAKACGPDLKWADAQKTIYPWRPKAPGVSAYNALKYWGLVEALDRRDRDALKKAREAGMSGTGLWRITRKGWLFLTGRQAINREVFVFDDRVRKESDDLVTWAACCKADDGFNWNDIMAPAIAAAPRGILDSPSAGAGGQLGLF